MVKISYYGKTGVKVVLLFVKLQIKKLLKNPNLWLGFL